jgi:hypothetical protein
MAKQRNTHKRNTRKQRGRTYVGGDVPPPATRTYRTISCPLPRVTEQTIVKGTATSGFIAQAVSAQNPTYNFTLSGFNVGSGFYDQYRIEAVRFTITPQNNAIGLFTNSTTSVVPLYCVIDYDDSSALTSVGQANSYTTCVVLNPGESMERVFKPRMALAAYSGTFVGFANVADQWLDAASTTVQHYGVKLYIPGATAAQTLLQGWDITVEGFISLRKSI